MYYFVCNTKRLTSSYFKSIYIHTCNGNCILQQLFDPISPDKDTVSTREYSSQERRDNEFWLLQRLSQVMEKANFYELPESEIQSKLAEHERHEGVRVCLKQASHETIE